MWELEHKTEHWRTDVFELRYWRRHLRVPWTARISNQSILKEINPEYSLEGLILKPKLQYYGHLMWSANSLEKTLMLGKIEGRRRRGQQRASWMDGITQWTWVWASSWRWWWTGKPGMLQSMGSQRIRRDSGTEQPCCFSPSVCCFLFLLISELPALLPSPSASQPFRQLCEQYSVLKL